MRPFAWGARSRGACRPPSFKLVPPTYRASVGYMLSRMADSIDVIVRRAAELDRPRSAGGARAGPIGHLEGVCHVYATWCQPEMANHIVRTQDMRARGLRTAETRWWTVTCAATHLSPLVKTLLMRDVKCARRGERRVERE